MKVIVLGCGPAGLLAAHAAVRAGADDVRIVSKRRKSEMYGAQYLHASIPDITTISDGRLVRYQLDGTIDGYRDKVYGDAWRGHVSPDEFGVEDDHMAWNIRMVYDTLWELYGNGVSDFDNLSHDLVDKLSRKCDLLVSSIPAPALCGNEQHFFAQQPVWAVGDAPERGQFVPFGLAPTNTIRCNGEPNPSWYRFANIFGHRTIEWPGNLPQPPVDNVVRVGKPLRTNCDCLPNVMRVGRYGRWEKGRLVHEAYSAVSMVVSNG